ncbi:hypothetical protein DL96DRAFT_1033971 [Flagelloscypha sp. PMI_526]|nr:hypothetical protein DL96DRAFT_1033971 [Flagelloscypha sp. PMI_526]
MLPGTLPYTALPSSCCMVRAAQDAFFTFDLSLRFAMIFMTVWLLVSPVQASPVVLSPRATSSVSNPALWVPLIVVGLLVILAVVGTVFRKTNWRRHLTSASAGAAFSAQAGLPTSTGATRELTAEELAGATSESR